MNDKGLKGTVKRGEGGCNEAATRTIGIKEKERECGIETGTITYPLGALQRRHLSGGALVRRHAHRHGRVLAQRRVGLGKRGARVGRLGDAGRGAQAAVLLHQLGERAQLGEVDAERLRDARALGLGRARGRGGRGAQHGDFGAVDVEVVVDAGRQAREFGVDDAALLEGKKKRNNDGGDVSVAEKGRKRGRGGGWREMVGCCWCKGMDLLRCGRRERLQS